jgi:hypothetical protein
VVWFGPLPDLEQQLVPAISSLLEQLFYFKSSTPVGFVGSFRQRPRLEVLLWFGLVPCLVSGAPACSFKSSPPACGFWVFSSAATAGVLVWLVPRFLIRPQAHWLCISSVLHMLTKLPWPLC